MNNELQEALEALQPGVIIGRQYLNKTTGDWDTVLNEAEKAAILAHIEDLESDKTRLFNDAQIMGAKLIIHAEHIAELEDTIADLVDRYEPANPHEVK